MGIGYSEAALVANRACVLLWGGTEPDRRAWAEEAASTAGEGLRVAATDAEVERALQAARGVVYVPDAASLSEATQRTLVHCVREREEKPKIVAGLSSSPQRALDTGALRPDLEYALALGRVDLAAPEVKEGIKARRGAAAKRARAKPHPARRAPPKKGKAKKRR